MKKAIYLVSFLSAAVFVACDKRVVYPSTANTKVSGDIITYAGNGSQGFSGDGGVATAAELNYPVAVTADHAGNIYIADYQNIRVRKVSTNGIISTLAGNGFQGVSGDGGPATAAELNGVYGLAADASGNVYISTNSTIKKVNTTDIITVYAGNGTLGGFSGDGGPATAAELSGQGQIAFDGAGNCYLSDAGNQRIRIVNTTGYIYTFAGNGTQGFSGDGGLATAAELDYPLGVVADNAGNVYIADMFNYRIRMVNTGGIISTLAGNGVIGYSGDGGPATGAEFDAPLALAVDASGNLYIADERVNCIRVINTSGIISTFAGNNVYGYAGDGKPATAAELAAPVCIACDPFGNAYIADYDNQRIRKVLK